MAALPVTMLSVEGNIGSGKSTLLQHIERMLSREQKQHKSSVSVLQEPVQRWCEPVLHGGRMSMLQAFYDDSARNAFAFQMFALLTRADQMRQACLATAADVADAAPGAQRRRVVLTERCMQSDARLFAEPMARRSGALGAAEWHCYSSWHRALPEFIGVLPQLSGIAYVATDPECCLQRVRQRARNHGEDHLTLEYLSTLHEEHEAYIAEAKAEGTPVLYLDAKDPLEVQAAKLFGWVQSFLV